MKRRITIIRHAKSSWKHPQLEDYDRPLNGRGRRDAQEMGDRLRAEGFAPDLVLVSPALRTLRTIEAIAEVAEIPQDRLRFTPALYHASRNGMFEAARAVDTSVEHLVLVGHNPACETFSSALAGVEVGHLPTCAVVRLELKRGDLPWAELSGGCARLVWTDTPKVPRVSR